MTMTALTKKIRVRHTVSGHMSVWLGDQRIPASRIEVSWSGGEEADVKLSFDSRMVEFDLVDDTLPDPR